MGIQSNSLEKKKEETQINNNKMTITKLKILKHKDKHSISITNVV